MWAPENDSIGLPVIKKIDNPQELLANIFDAVQQKDARSLKTYILEHKIRDESIFWDLILKIGSCITAETSENNPDFFDVCCRCLLYLVKVGNPKETLLALLEQVDTFIDDIKFKNFLPPIQTALMKIQSKLFHSLDITLETVSSHLRCLELPENTQLEGDEVKLFHFDRSVVRLADILYAYLKFLEPFVSAVDVHLENQTVAARQEALVLKKHIIRLFEHPLCHLILTYDPVSNQAKSDSRLCAELAVTLLAKVETDFHKLMKTSTERNDKGSTNKGDDDKQHLKDENVGQEEYDNQENERKLASGSVSNNNVTDIVEAWDFKLEIVPLAKACLAYLIHVEHLGINKVPAVFRRDYILDFHLDVICILLKNTNFPINYKGLLLCKTLTELVPKNFIALDCLDNPKYMSVINDLIHIMVKCPVRDHRTLATKIFPTFISRFVAAGRYQIYQSVLISCDHSGLKGYLITILKNDINDNIKNALPQSILEKGEGTRTKDSVNIPSDYFVGKKLEKLMKLVVVLPEKETTDMLENSDMIISALNLLRFLILADSPAVNVTGFWKFLPDIDKDFLSPLRRGLDLSKAHYILELETMKHGKSGLEKQAEMSVLVEGMNLPMIEQKEKVDLLEKAVNTHHVMMSLLGRVSELVDQQRRLLNK